MGDKIKSDLILFCFTSMEGSEPGTSCTQGEDGTFQTLLKHRMHTVGVLKMHMYNKGGVQVKKKMKVAKRLPLTPINSG